MSKQYKRREYRIVQNVYGTYNVQYKGMLFWKTIDEPDYDSMFETRSPVVFQDVELATTFAIKHAQDHKAAWERQQRKDQLVVELGKLP